MNTTKKLIALTCGLIMSIPMTACSMPWQGKNEDVKIEKDSSKEEEKASLSVGYINLTNGENSVDLYSDTDETSVLAKMFQDDPITIYSIDGEWATVGYGGTKGVVRLESISFSEPSQEENEESSEKTINEPANAESKLQENDNSSANEDITINIMFFMDDDGFEVAKPLSYHDYVEEHDARNAWCSVESIYIYSQPDVNSAKREANMLYYGDELTVLGTVDDWYYISTDSGNGYDLHGYVAKKYITFGDSPAAPENANATHGCVSVNSANVRSTPNKETNDNVLFALKKGDEFDVLSYDGYWYKIVYQGTVCYISHKMVEVW